MKPSEPVQTGLSPAVDHCQLDHSGDYDENGNKNPIPKSVAAIGVQFASGVIIEVAACAVCFDYLARQDPNWRLIICESCIRPDHVSSQWVRTTELINPSRDIISFTHFCPNCGGIKV